MKKYLNPKNNLYQTRKQIKQSMTKTEWKHWSSIHPSSIKKFFSILAEGLLADEIEHESAFDDQRI